MKRSIFFLLFLLPVLHGKAQIKKFGKVSAAEFALKDKPEYKNDDAIELFKKRRTYFEYNQNEGWVLITTVHERILLKNKNGFKYATNVIKFFGKERIKIRASTYNLVAGTIDETKLNANNIYQQDLYMDWHEKRFTMPNLKPGSIVEWEYKIKSPYFAFINDMVYQRLIPILYLDAKVTVPEYFNFNYYTTQYAPVQLNIIKGNTIYETGVDVNTTIFSLNMSDIPPVRKEPYISHINNYIGRVKFNLQYVKIPGKLPKKFSKTWEDVCETLYRTLEFGDQLDKSAYFKNDLARIYSPSDSLETKMLKILAFVKQKVRWNQKNGIFSDNGVVQAYKSGHGNVAEINFILISMLREAGVEAYPVLTSTLDYGIPLFPTIFGFNYMVTAVKKNNGYILIDPTEKFAPPGVLPRRTLNWFGQLVKDNGTSESINLFPDYYNLSVTNVNAGFDGTNIKGFGNNKKTGNYALEARKTFDGLNTEQVIAKLKETYPAANIQNARIQQLMNIDQPLGILYQFEMEDALEEVGDKTIFYPALFLRTAENPFKAETRKYPVYFGYPFIHLYIIDLKIPPTYKIQKLPENVTYTLPDNLGAYNYKIQQTSMGLRVEISIKISKPVIPANRYKALKELYEKIISKESEPVILSKN